MSDSIYRSPGTDLDQGDIIEGVPHLCVRPPLEILRRVTMRGGRQHWAPFPYPPEEGKTPDATGPGKTISLPPFHVKDGEFLAGHAQFTRAIILNYECDLIHEEDSALVAIVRPMAAVHEEDRQTIRENRNYNHFYLPADEAFELDEGYADFRRVTSLDPALLETVGTRKASLTTVGVKGLQAQFIRFVTRRDLRAE